jgi:hypothetical protein
MYLYVSTLESESYAGYRLHAAAARGSVPCFASQSPYHFAARGRTNIAAFEVDACRAKSERFFVSRQRDFRVMWSFSWDGLVVFGVSFVASMNSLTLLPCFDAGHEHIYKRINKWTSLPHTKSCARQPHSIEPRLILRQIGQLASLSWNKAPVWGLWPDIYYCRAVAGLLIKDTLSNERTGVPFTITPGPRQRSHFRVWVPWDSWSYFTVSDSRLSFS